jgi:hypothetical protein
MPEIGWERTGLQASFTGASILLERIDPLIPDPGVRAITPAITLIGGPERALRSHVIATAGGQPTERTEAPEEGRHETLLNRLRSRHSRDRHDVEGRGRDRLEALARDVVMLRVAVASPALRSKCPCLGCKW